MQKFDAIVLGLGGMGSAALYHLARRGLRACGVDRFELAHAQGSSHGQSRLIRRAYFEHPGYVPLVDASWRLWRELEEVTGQSLLLQTGLVLAGPPDGAIICGTRAAAQIHALSISDVSSDDAATRWPGLAFSPDDAVLFEADAGRLRVEACVQAHVSAAERLGAVALFSQAVTSWSADSTGVTVVAGGQTLAADRLIICGGAWTAGLLADLPVPLQVVRKTVFWYPRCAATMHAEASCPAFGFDTPAGFLYGFPRLDERGVKVANHSGGETVADPDRLNRTVEASETGEVEAFRRRHLPGLAGPPGEASVCMYTMSPDQHFIVDQHPGHANVAVACGFSGHGFKFAPEIGRVLAAWAGGEAIVHGVLQPLACGRRA